MYMSTACSYLLYTVSILIIFKNLIHMHAAISGIAISYAWVYMHIGTGACDLPIKITLMQKIS